MSGSIAPWVLVAVLPVTFFAFNNLLAVTWPDRKADAEVGKNTLATRLKPGTLKTLHGSCIRARVATMKGGWRRFLKGLPIESKFIHRNEYKRIYGDDTPLPTTFIEEDGELTLIISSSEYNELTTLKGLETLLKTRFREQVII